jgi:HD-like signal output (HDOD) protein
MKILIVDDEETIRRYLGRILKSNGFDVASIEDGTQSVIAAAAEHPDLILMDLEMPKVSGTEAIRALKSDPSTRSIPVIVLTGMATPDAVVAAARAGAQDFVVKTDLRIDEFIARLWKALPGGLPAGAAQTGPPPAKGPAPKEPGAGRKGRSASILDRQRVEAHLRDSVDLKALPFVAAEALKIASTPNADVGQLTQTLARDPALSATLLQLSNSAFFTAQTRVQSLNQAIMRLGLRRVGEIATAIKLIEEFRGGGKKSAIDRVEMWRHALGTAVLARDLASACKLPPDTVEGAFLAGLLHDLGQAFLADHFPAPYGKILALAAKRRAPLHEVEREACGIDHAEVARRILAKWRLHPDLVDAIAQHEVVAEATGLRPIVWLANLLARTARIGTDGDDTVDLVPDELVARIGLDGDRVERALAGADEQVRTLSEILLLHPQGGRPAPAPPPPLPEHVQAVMVVQTPRLVEPLELLLKHYRWNVRRVAALGEAASDPSVQALVVRSRTPDWLREQLEQAADEGAKQLNGRRPLVVCPEGPFPRELKGLLRAVGGESADHPLSLTRVIRLLQGSGERR